MGAITESEAEIMELLWENGEMTIMQMVQALEEKKNWSKQSVISFLRRMETKGTVSYRVQGRARLYSAKVGKDQVLVSETKNFADRFFDGKLGLMASYFVHNPALTEEDIEELWNELSKLKEKKNE